MQLKKRSLKTKAALKSILLYIFPEDYAIPYYQGIFLKCDKLKLFSHFLIITLLMLK